MWKWIKQHDEMLEAVFWVLQLAPAWYFGWLFSTMYVSVLSVYALVKGCVAAHHAKMGRKEGNNGGS